jgi:hypothetical protein
VALEEAKRQKVADDLAARRMKGVNEMASLAGVNTIMSKIERIQNSARAKYITQPKKEPAQQMPTVAEETPDAKRGDLNSSSAGPSALNITMDETP